MIILKLHSDNCCTLMLHESKSKKKRKSLNRTIGIQLIITSFCFVCLTHQPFEMNKRLNINVCETFNPSRWRCVPVRHGYLLVRLLTFLVAFLIKPASIFVTFWLRWQMSSPWWWRLPDRPEVSTTTFCQLACSFLDCLLLLLGSLLNPGCCGSCDNAVWPPGWPLKSHVMSNL